ncbi:MAG TPA: DUF58 domain-containing protein [Blastocatellia bacterium]|nr:DUF58 domain-containing protein [Blastocatellia bacterium]
MRFVFTRRFYLLLAFGLVLLSLAWVNPSLIWLTLIYDTLLFASAVFDYLTTEKPDRFVFERYCDHRFSMGAENTVRLAITNEATRPVKFLVKDEYPTEMMPSVKEAEVSVSPRRTREFNYTLFADARGDYSFGGIAARYDSNLKLIWKQAKFKINQTIKVYPNIQEAKKNELYAHRNRELRMGQRKMRFKGQGREFESLREFVPGDEIRHISWSASARRGKLVTREYQVERSQNIVVMLDAGRMMTARIEKLTKLDHAINAALSIAYVALSGGDNIGLLSFCRKVISYLPPKHGYEQLNQVMEGLYSVKPQLIEPNYSRAFNFLSANCRKRSLIVILTDLIDRESSAELLTYTQGLIPRHLPLIVTIGDNDLRGLVKQQPKSVSDVYRQSVAEELLQQREEALARIVQAGGLALDVPAGRLSFELVNKYLEVKERGLI